LFDCLIVVALTSNRNVENSWNSENDRIDQIMSDADVRALDLGKAERLLQSSELNEQLEGVFLIAQRLDSGV
jgi:hypothetical protein